MQKPSERDGRQKTPHLCRRAERSAWSRLAEQGNVVKTLACNLLTLAAVARQCAYESIAKQRCRLRKRKRSLLGLETSDKGDERLVMRMQLVTKVPF